MAHQQKFSRLTDKTCVVQKWAGAGICPRGAAFCHRFSWRIIIPVSSATRGRIWAGVYLPLSKIILIHNPFQMSYWLGEASLPFSIRGFYLQYIQLRSPNTCLPGRERKDRDIWKTQTESKAFTWLNAATWRSEIHRFCFMHSWLCRSHMVNMNVSRLSTQFTQNNKLDEKSRDFQSF